MKPATMDAIQAPVPPPPPRPSNRMRYPPITAPTMPMMIVTTMPPGSSPGMTSLASAPAMRPTMIQKIMAVSISVPLLPRRFVYDQTCTHEVSYSKHHHRVHRYLQVFKRSGAAERRDGQDLLSSFGRFGLHVVSARCRHYRTATERGPKTPLLEGWVNRLVTYSFRFFPVTVTHEPSCRRERLSSRD